MLMQNKQNLILRLTCLFWIISRIDTYKVWMPQGRLYPVVPVFEFLDAIPLVVHTILFVISMLGLGLIFVFPQKRIIAISTLSIIVFSCMLDILRWQAWEYQLIFFLFAFVINKDKPKSFYSAIVFILASVYVYSGAHKLNGGFLLFVWEQMILKFLGVPKGLHHKMHYIGIVVPLTEIAAGLSLLFIKNKIIPLFMLVSMHLFILAMLLIGFSFPVMSTVPVWNVSMTLFLILFYYLEEYSFSFADLWPGANKLVPLFWGILPALCFVGLWDDYLSSALYSGNLKFLDLCIKDTAKAKQFEPYFNNDIRHVCNGQAKLGTFKWSFEETNVLPYPERWYFKKFKTKFEKMYPDVEVEFVVHTYPFREKAILGDDTETVIDLTKK